MSNTMQIAWNKPDLLEDRHENDGEQDDFDGGKLIQEVVDLKTELFGGVDDWLQMRRRLFPIMRSGVDQRRSVRRNQIPIRRRN